MTFTVHKDHPAPGDPGSIEHSAALAIGALQPGESVYMPGITGTRVKHTIMPLVPLRPGSHPMRYDAAGCEVWYIDRRPSDPDPRIPKEPMYLPAFMDSLDKALEDEDAEGGRVHVEVVQSYFKTLSKIKDSGNRSKAFAKSLAWAENMGSIIVDNEGTDKFVRLRTAKDEVADLFS